MSDLDIVVDSLPSADYHVAELSWMHVFQLRDYRQLHVYTVKRNLLPLSHRDGAPRRDGAQDETSPFF